MVVERLNRGQEEEVVRIGMQFNASTIEDIILQKRWPKAECKVCGKSHDASIQKVCESEDGGEFRFCEPECPNAPKG
ncbi:MAG: hypothetical protein FWH25_04235 [Syntrophorhabdaceae bacterium]|nr:hypothetical protein [Syntrophorhabdaceae bacterium]